MMTVILLTKIALCEGHDFASLPYINIHWASASYMIPGSLYNSTSSLLTLDAGFKRHFDCSFLELENMTKVESITSNNFVMPLFLTYSTKTIIRTLIKS